MEKKGSVKTRGCSTASPYRTRKKKRRRYQGHDQRRIRYEDEKGSVCCHFLLCGGFPTCRRGAGCHNVGGVARDRQSGPTSAEVVSDQVSKPGIQRFQRLRGSGKPTTDDSSSHLWFGRQPGRVSVLNGGGEVKKRSQPLDSFPKRFTFSVVEYDRRWTC